MKIYLASASPRRKQLLTQIGLEFLAIDPEIDEIIDDRLKPEEYVKANAILKAQKVRETYSDGLIIAADTIVVKNKTILGKPRDQKDAFQMLRSLSGQTHYVFTAVAVARTKELKVAVEKTKVTMRKLTHKEIRTYISSGEPLDAAGAYKIQEKGAKFISRIEGCYYNVVGLPIVPLIEMLKTFGVDI